MRKTHVLSLCIAVVVLLSCVGPTNTAVAQGSESWVRRNGERGRFVWTDTWILRNDRWQIVAAEDLVPPAKPEKNK